MTNASTLVLLFAVTFAGCSGSRNPTAPGIPSSIPVPGSQAMLKVLEFSVVKDAYNGRYACSVISLVLSETSGLSGATITKIGFHLENAIGNLPPVPLPKTTSIKAGDSAQLADGPNPYGSYSYNFDSSIPFSGVTVSVSYQDDAGRTGAVTAFAPMP